MREISERKTIVIGVTVDHAITYHKLLSKELARLGFRVHVISSGGPALEKLGKDISTHILPMSRQPDPVNDLRALWKWLKLVASLKPDVVVAGTPKASMLGMLAARILNVPVRVYWVHGLRLETASGPLRAILLAIERMTSRNATTLIAVSNTLKNELVNLGIAKSEKIEILGAGSTQGVDLAHFKRVSSAQEREEILLEVGLDPRRKTIGFVGRLTAEKGISELTEALINIQNQELDIQALFIGAIEDSASVESLKFLKSAGVPFVSVGEVADTSKYFRSMDVFCLPSYREGLPNVILESFASGVPVVGTRVTGITDIIDEGITGLLVDRENVDDLTNALIQLLHDDELAEELADSAYKFVCNNYSSEQVVHEQVAFIKKKIK